MNYTLSIKLKDKDRPFFGPGPMKLLLYVQAGDSLHQAAAKMGMAYSKAWRIIAEAEKGFGVPLLTRQRGGAGGGGSALTEDAAKLLAKYGQFQKEMYRVGDQLFQDYFGSTLSYGGITDDSEENGTAADF